ncbi:MAG: hypothetical protein MJY64_01495 [archaeon]|nr:hypothetical protein [archaeon]
MSTVVAKMKFCNKMHKVTVKQKDDGTFSLHIATDCPEVRDYANALGDTLTLDDLTDVSESKIFSYENLTRVTMTCLAPNAVINAAWAEAGMLSKSRAKEIKENVISFEKIND